MIFDPILDFFRGKAVTIPPLDGAFRPNSGLEQAKVAATLSEPDNLIVLDGVLHCSSGNALYRLASGEAPQAVQSFDAPITALAVSPTGKLAVALETAVLLVGDEPIHLLPEIRAITALAFAADGSLWLANGSSEHSASDWATDLMKKRATGSLWVRRKEGEAFHKKASGLAFPYGLLPRAGGSVVFSESWRHRLMEIDADGHISALIEQIPGYPARLMPSDDGGAVMAVFAPRNRLIELVLQESHYRFDMIATVPRAYWIAPALSSGKSFLEPLQCGGIRSMGVHKPWSPSRSYGLVVRLDREMNPVSSYHSRADGKRHGICSAIAFGGEIHAASRGGDIIVSLADKTSEVH
ncbi:hypothetical protein [Martelella sp. HB161492]|uniref:hypothetical protein n=1 Tax=Martelella sp. HB161492 TaxID=2720726 RepID=UPI001591A0CE|nr:hypothetical protein [Martelella sp. HB161492]